MKQNLYLEGERGDGEGNLVDACLSCPGTLQGEGRHGGLSTAWQASTGGYRSILEQADQRRNCRETFLRYRTGQIDGGCASTPRNARS